MFVAPLLADSHAQIRGLPAVARRRQGAQQIAVAGQPAAVRAYPAPPFRARMA